jgi:hypothetical protein
VHLTQFPPKRGYYWCSLHLIITRGPWGGLDLSDLVFTVRYFNHKICQKFRTKNQILGSAENFGTKILIVYSSLIHKLSEMCRFPTSEKECNVRASKSSKNSTHIKIDEKWDKIKIEISLLTSKNVYSITQVTYIVCFLHIHIFLFSLNERKFSIRTAIFSKSVCQK